MRITDGFPTTFNLLVGDSGETIEESLFWWEKTVAPMGIQGGGANDITSMRNTRWRTRHPKKLLTLSEASITAAYDPQILEELVDLAQENRRWMTLFPDGSAWIFWGWFDELSPNDHEEGSEPDADVTIIPSNVDDDLEEVAPQYLSSVT
jgi:hypothetical protein